MWGSVMVKGLALRKRYDERASFATHTDQPPESIRFWIDQAIRSITMPTVSGHTSAIRAKKVIGTSIKDPTGATIGKVEDIVLDKLSNNIMFAVVGFGGFLGIGEKFHPLPWSTLDYEEKAGGYVIDLSKDKLKAGPAYSMEELMQGDGTQFRDRVYDYYGAKRYW
jgi:hypothetical protein